MGCKSHLNNSYFTSEVFSPNFTAYRKDQCIGGGGIFVVASDNLTSLDDPIIDVSAVYIHGMAPMYICAFYRLPNCDVEPIIQLRKFLSSLCSEKSTITYMLC